MKTSGVFNKYDHSNISNLLKTNENLGNSRAKIKSMLKDCIGETYSQLKYYIQSKIDNAIEDNKSLTIFIVY